MRSRSPRLGQGREERVDGDGFDPRPDGGERRVAGRAAVYDEARHVIPADGAYEAYEWLGHRGRDRPRSLGLNEGQRTIAGWHHQVDLEPLMISEVIDLFPASLIELVFDDLRGDESFEQRSKER